MCYFFLSVVTVISSTELKYHFSSKELNKWLDDFHTESFLYVMGTENIYFTQNLSKESSPPSLTSVTLDLFTNIRFNDIRSLFGNEIAGLKSYETKILVAGKGTDYTNLPIESAPPMEVLLQERKESLKQLEELEELEQEAGKPKESKPPTNTTNGRKVVYIYHSHSRESFLPYLKGETNPDNAHDSILNITLVGKKLGEALERRGIGTQVDTTDIVQLLDKNGLNYFSSYKMSREVVASAMATNKDINYIFDIHRDSQRKDVTTVSIDGKAYAKLFFVIGTEHPNYDRNLNFAKEINAALDEKYPGLSRGIFEKGRKQGNGVYNQDLSSNSIIIEIGGVDNNMEELERTVEALADIVSEFYWDAEKVNAY